VQDKHDYGNDQDDVNQASRDVHDKTEKPKDNQDDGNNH